MGIYIGNQYIPTVRLQLSGTGVNNYQIKTVTPTGTVQNIVPDSGYDALSQVTVNAIPSQYVIPSGTLTINSNGTVNVANYASVTVNVSTGSNTPSLQAKTNINPSTSSQTITADSGYDGLSSVQINAMPSMTLPTAVSTSGSGTNKLTINRSTSAQYINIPTGYNAAAAYYTIAAVANMTLPTSAATSSSGTSKLTITPTTSNRYINIPTGYNTTASYYTISGDANLIASNIKSGVSIFGVTGSYSGSGGGTPSLQAKTGINPSTSSQTITADSGYDGLSSVQINAMPSGSATTPATTITANPSLSTTYTSGSGYLMSVSKTQSVTPTVSAGYVSAGTAGTITVSGSAYVAQSTLSTASSLPSGSSSSGTLAYGQYLKISAGYYPSDRYYRSYATTGSATGPTSISQSSATLSTGTNTITLTKTNVSTTPTVTAGYIASATSSTATVTLTASVTTQAATTYNVSTNNQTIAAGRYLTGAQTIRGVTHSGLDPANIASGVTVKIGDAADDDRIISVTGTLAFVTYYTGSSTPSSSLGSNGDIYLQS